MALIVTGIPFGGGRGAGCKDKVQIADMEYDYAVCGRPSRAVSLNEVPHMLYFTTSCFHILRISYPFQLHSSVIIPTELSQLCGSGSAGAGASATTDGEDDSADANPNGQSTLINDDIFHEQCQSMFPLLRSSCSVSSFSSTAPEDGTMMTA